jgi:hypothetical protein
MMAAITHFREMFKLFYGDEVVDGTTTQGTLEPFDQGEHFQSYQILFSFSELANKFAKN